MKHNHFQALMIICFLALPFANCAVRVRPAPVVVVEPAPVHHHHHRRHHHKHHKWHHRHRW